MMQPTRLAAFSTEEIERCLRGAGLTLEVADFRCLIRSDTGLLAEPLRLLYQHYPASDQVAGFYDFRLTMNRKRGMPWGEKEVEFVWEGRGPFPALPLAQTHPLFEWGLNWCIATMSGTHAVIHSAVVERHGRAIVLPGDPGAGKSTLCAALALTDWRLLSDELTIVSQATSEVQAMPRPISLKNHSIEVVRTQFPAAELTKPIADTHKGAIAYVRPADAAVDDWRRTARIAYVLFPRYADGCAFRVDRISRAEALAELMSHTFNVGLLGRPGFEALAKAVAGADCYAVEYPDLASITEWIDATCQSPCR